MHNEKKEILQWKRKCSQYKKNIKQYKKKKHSQCEKKKNKKFHNGITSKQWIEKKQQEDDYPWVRVIGCNIGDGPENREIFFYWSLIRVQTPLWLIDVSINQNGTSQLSVSVYSLGVKSLNSHLE